MSLNPKIQHPATNSQDKHDLLPEAFQGAFVLENEFARVVSLGLFDVLRKSKTQGFVLNLSGGKDSAACAVLVYLMVQLGLKELGEAEFRKKLEHIHLPEDPRQFLRVLLYCFYQGTENSSESTQKAARSLAETLNISFSTISVDAIVQAYCDLFPDIIHRSLSWKQDDIALQNIQARVRSPSIWLLANLRNAIVLCSSNRSEAAVGYMTMDGDTAGGLAPIAGVSKTFIQHWLYCMETEGLPTIPPIPALRAINEQTPTAELRPQKAQQYDESDLMPYEWLDEMVRLFVGDKKSPLEMLEFLVQTFPKISPHHWADKIEQFLELWCHNQWKRERIAASFHLDEESLDPKTYCRFPIFSGRYQNEIQKMRAYLNLIMKK